MRIDYWPATSSTQLEARYKDQLRRSRAGSSRFDFSPCVYLRHSPPRRLSPPSYVTLLQSRILLSVHYPSYTSFFVSLHVSSYIFSCQWRQSAFVLFRSFFFFLGTRRLSTLKTSHLPVPFSSVPELRRLSETSFSPQRCFPIRLGVFFPLLRLFVFFQFVGGDVFLPLFRRDF